MKDINEIKVRILLSLSFVFKTYFYITMFLSKIRGQKPVKTFSSLESAKEYIKNKGFYKRDKIDSILHPARIQHNISRLGYIGDCDDFSMYWAAILLKSKLATNVSLGSCYYEKPNGRLVGHTVCVFRGLNGVLYWANYGRIHMSTRSNTWYHAIGNVHYGKRLIGVTTLEIKEIKENDDIVFGKLDKYIFTKEK